MGIVGIVVLVVLGFGNHVWWLAAVALYLLLRRPSGAVENGRPGSYQAYRERRDRQARWERRYRRERSRRWF
ncbi:MAG TPA: hypothetical protein VIU15_22775 [Streptomyces sp.]